MNTLRKTQLILQIGIMLAGSVGLLIGQAILPLTAMADSTTSQTTLSSGSLTETIISPYPSVSAALTGGLNATPSTTLNVQVTDATGTGNGWHLTITSTLFVYTLLSPTPVTTPSITLPSNAVSISSASQSCATGSTCTLPNNTVAFGEALPAQATAPAAIEFYNAATTPAPSGMGVSDIGTTLSFNIPGNTIPGTYTDNIQLAIASGP